jgi:hypothetical protein
MILFDNFTEKVYPIYRISMYKPIVNVPINVAIISVVNTISFFSYPMLMARITSAIHCISINFFRRR